MNQNRNVLVLLGLIAAIGFLGGIAIGQEMRGRIPFDVADAPEPTIAVNLSGKLLALISQSVKHEPDMAELAAMIGGIYVRGYDTASGGIDAMVRHCESIIKRDKWELIVKVKEKEDRINVYLLADTDVVHGIFVMVANPDETIFVNIFGKIDFNKVGNLIEHLDDFDIELPELEDLTEHRQFKRKFEDK